MLLHNRTNRLQKFKLDSGVFVEILPGEEKDIPIDHPRVQAAMANKELVPHGWKPPEKKKSGKEKTEKKKVGEIPTVEVVAESDKAKKRGRPKKKDNE